MFKNYIRTFLRNLWKSKTYSFLNIAGLAVGIACAGLIFLWVENETGYDSGYTKKDRLYAIREHQVYEGVQRTFIGSPGVLAPAMKDEIPGVVNTCRTTWVNKTLLSLGDKSVYEPGFYVDSSTFSLFGFSFLQGSAKDAFNELYSIVITEKMAGHFFGTEKNIIGRSLTMDNQQKFIVTGVIKDLPDNSTLKFDWAAPFEIFRKKNDWLQYWAANGVKTYVELSPSASSEMVDKQLYDFMHKKDKRATAHPFLFAMKDWHLRDDLLGQRSSYVRLFSIIAWIILLIACINFMNLATARSEKRAREVGVRKVLGARKRSLVWQFIGEAIAMSAIAVFLGLLLIQLALPSFNLLVQEELSTGLGNPLHIGALFAIALLCGLVAGSYPALYLSSFNPVFVFKGIRLKGGGAVFIRKGLVVLQFSVSIVLIISTVIVYRQIQHIRGRDIGYDRANLLDMDVRGDMVKNFAAIKQDLLNTGVVENVALSSQESMYTSDNTTGFEWEGKDPSRQTLISFRMVNPSYFATMAMHILEGRDFRPGADMKADSSNILITESMARLLGKGSPIGKPIRNGNGTLHVIGVVKDYIYGDFYSSPDPVIFFAAPEESHYLYVRYKANSRPEEVLAKVGAVIKKDNPAYPFTYTFIDEQFNAIFKGEFLVGKLAGVFAALAIFISCLGLFGLAAYTAERRTREIGIRKVLGASVTGITRLLTWDFLGLVFISTLVAFPVAWWAMHRWLQGYAYRTTISWWVFIVAGLAAMLIALVTISFQSVKAALSNPLKNLRSE
ncbi:MAG TPA: ABC transporter permease [Puia sp.]|nr:ABC transporter permease [Puia sp.]